MTYDKPTVCIHVILSTATVQLYSIDARGEPVYQNGIYKKAMFMCVIIRA